jgi:hypothetical protein
MVKDRNDCDDPFGATSRGGKHREGGTMTADMVPIWLGPLLIIEIVIFVVSVLAWLQIITKAGYSGWWLLVGLLPFVNAILFLVFAFSRWPIQQRLEAAERSTWYGSRPGGHYHSPPERPYPPTPRPAGYYPSAPSGPPSPRPTERPLPSLDEFLSGMT